MLQTACGTQRVLEDNRRMSEMISTLQRQERRLATNNKRQRTDIETLTKRLEQFGADNDDLLEKLAEMKSDRARREREFDAQMKEVAEKLRQLEEGGPVTTTSDDEALRTTTEQLEAAKQRCDELERLNAELQARLETTEPSAAPDQPVVGDSTDVGQLRRELADITRRLADSDARHAAAKQELEQAARDKTDAEEKFRQLTETVETMQRHRALAEQQEEMLRDQLDKLKRTLEACAEAEEELKRQLQRVVDKNRELEELLEQLRVEQSEAKKKEKLLRDELDEAKRANAESEAREAELKRQLAKALEDYDTLNRKTQAEIERLKDDVRNKAEEIDALKKANLEAARNERQLKAKLEEAQREAESSRKKFQQEIETLKNDLRASEEAYNKVRKERDEMLEKWVPRERLEEAERQLQEMKTIAEQWERRIQELQDEMEAVQRTAQQREQELTDDIARLQSELKTREEQLEEAAQKLRDQEQKYEKLKSSYEEKEKQWKKEQERLKQAMREQQKQYMEKLRAREAQHLVEKERMLQMWNEKEKELKNKMRQKELEIRAEVEKVQAKCDELEKAHEEKLKEKEDDFKLKAKKLKEDIEASEKLAEEATEKIKELQKIIDDHVSQEQEVKSLRAINDELREKVGKLERAVLRLRLDNDDLQQYKVYNGKNGNVKQLVTEQTAHISDLQMQVEMLRQALKDLSKQPPPQSSSRREGQSTAPAADYHTRLLGEAVQLLATARDVAGKRPPAAAVAEASQPAGLAGELEAERSKVRAGNERIAQLERWLDTIFNDNELGIGPTTAANNGSPDEPPTVSLPPVNRSSNQLTSGASPADGYSSKSQRTNRSPSKQKHNKSSKR